MDLKLNGGAITPSSFFPHVSGGEALDQMRTENQNLAQSLAARAVHKVQAKRKPIEKGVEESSLQNFFVLYSSPHLFEGGLTLFSR